MTKENVTGIMYVGITFMLISLAIPTVIWLKDFYTGFGDTIDSSKVSDYATFQTFIIAFWGLLSNLILVVIAYKAFQNFGVKEQFHNKQLSLVTELATEMSSSILSNMMYETYTSQDGEDHLIATGYTLSFFEISLGFDYKKFDYMYIKSKNIEGVFPFIRHRNNPVLPPSIARQLNKLYRPLQYSINVNKEKKPKNYVVIYVENATDDYSKEWLYKYYESPTAFTADCRVLRTSISDWFKAYGANDVNI